MKSYWITACALVVGTVPALGHLPQLKLASQNGQVVFGVQHNNDGPTVTEFPSRMFVHHFGHLDDPADATGLGRDPHYSSTFPGYGFVAPTGYTEIPNGHTLYLNSIAGLSSWDVTASAFIAANETVETEYVAQAVIGVSGFTGYQLGTKVALSSHFHPIWELLPASNNTVPADGIYLFQLQAYTMNGGNTGLSSSLPFYLLMTNGNIATDQLDNAQAWVYQHFVPEPSSVWLLILSAVGLTHRMC